MTFQSIQHQQSENLKVKVCQVLSLSLMETLVICQVQVYLKEAQPSDWGATGVGVNDPGVKCFHNYLTRYIYIMLASSQYAILCEVIKNIVNTIEFENIFFTRR